MRIVPAMVPHRSRADAQLASRLQRCLDQFRVIGKSEVVIAGKIDDFLAVIAADRAC